MVFHPFVIRRFAIARYFFSLSMPMTLAGTVVETSRQHCAAATKWIEKNAASGKNVLAPPCGDIIGRGSRMMLGTAQSPASRNRQHIKRRSATSLVGCLGNGAVAIGPSIGANPKSEVGPVLGHHRL